MRKQQDGHRPTAWGVPIVVIVSSMMLAAAPPPRRYVMETYPQTLNTNSVSITLQAMGEAPEFVAVSVRQGEPEFNKGYDR